MSQTKSIKRFFSVLFNTFFCRDGCRVKLKERKKIFCARKTFKTRTIIIMRDEMWHYETRQSPAHKTFDIKGDRLLKWKQKFARDSNAINKNLCTWRAGLQMFANRIAYFQNWCAWAVPSEIFVPLPSASCGARLWATTSSEWITLPHDTVSRLENENMTKNLFYCQCDYAMRAPSLIKTLTLGKFTHIKSGNCFSVEHLLTKAQNTNPSRHDVVMLSTLTL